MNAPAAFTPPATRSSAVLDHDPNCIFCKIVAGHIPARKVYEDEHVLAFHDIAPWADVHLLLIPKRHIPSMAQITPADAGLMGHMMTLAPQLAAQHGCRPFPEGGFRLIANAGDDAMQEVHHLHWHIIGGARPWKRG